MRFILLLAAQMLECVHDIIYTVFHTVARHGTEWSEYIAVVALVDVEENSGYSKFQFATKYKS